MKHWSRVVVALVGLVALSVVVASTAAAKGDAARKGPETHVVGYFIQWGVYGRNYTVKDIETSGSASKLDVINYAFGNVAPNGEGDVVCQSGDEWADYQMPWSAERSVTGEAVSWPNPILGNFQQLKALKAMHPGLKVLMSLGGWTWSKYFSQAAATQTGREKLVSSCIDLFIKGNLPDPGWGGMGGPGSGAGVFDGFDIDWEWPGSAGNAGNIVSPADKQNLTKLLAEFRSELDAYGEETGEHYLLTQFLPADPAKIDAGFEVRDVFRYLDFATVQGYDLHGGWESTTNHQSNLYTSPRDPSSPKFSVDDTVKAYVSRQAPKDKLVIGVPFYSRGWTGVGAADNGLYQSATGLAPGVWEAGVNDYKAVKPLLGEGFTRYSDKKSGDAAWLFDGTTFWTFDDPAVMTEKADYVLQKHLGGIMFWELSGDTAGGELIDAIASGLGS